MQNEFNKCISQVVTIIKDRHYLLVNEKLAPIEDEIKEINTHIENLNKEFEEKKGIIRTKLDETLAMIETQNAAEISDCEARIEFLNDINGQNPQKVFTQTMGYNVMLTIIVSLMGGCAGYSNGSVHDMSELKNLLSLSLLSGLKWGIISFLIGLLIAVIVSVFSAVERSGKRQKLLKRIGQLKNQKEHLIQAVKKEAEIKIRNISEFNSIETERLNSLLGEIENRRAQKEIELSEEAELSFRTEAGVFEALLIDRK